MRDEIECRAARAAELLAADPRVRLVYLFGSAARHGAVAPRDLDLAVLARPALRTPELLRLQGELQEELATPVDLVSLNDAPIVLAHEVVEGGRCLYARSPDDETELVTRTRMRWWDWLPVREAQWRASGERLEERLGPQA
jgi:predicted nucleotidyltransferase